MTQITQQTDRRRGSILMATAVFMAIAALALVAIFAASNTYSRINNAAYERERAFQLADAGLLASIVSLNHGGAGAFNTAQSREFFAATNILRADNWGFATSISNLTASRKRIVSTGDYGQHGRVTVVAEAHKTSNPQSVHSLFAHAIYAGNSSKSTNYVLRIGGTGSGADRVVGDVYSGNNIQLTGDAKLRLPESFVDVNGNGIFDSGDVRTDAGATTTHNAPLTPEAYAAYLTSMQGQATYPNSRFDEGEAFVDTIGNGVYDPGEGFQDLDGDGVYGFGEPFNDLDGDGVFSAGEAFVDHGNGAWDTGESFEDRNNNGTWDAATAGYWETVRIKGRNQKVWREGTAAEPFEDRGNGQFDDGESFVDRNGVYDPGEEFFDDRNGRYDYGTQATGTITGMPSPGTGQQSAVGTDEPLAPPNLNKMYYERPRTASAPSDASNEWGHDVDVASAHFNSSGRVNNANDPAHIFVKNPSNRTYTRITGKNDYFLEDPTDKSYGNSKQYLNVKDNGNEKVYYVDGNVYLHNPNTYDFMFRNPGTRITIVANGNITLSDEFMYNGGTENPLDSLALIARKDPNVANSGNIYLGDSQFGTGGEMHAMLYAENNFVDNNLDTVGQPYLSVFGTMSAGNQVAINRDGLLRTRLDVILDERIVERRFLPPGLPQATSGQRSITVAGGWELVPGSWYSRSPLH